MVWSYNGNAIKFGTSNIERMRINYAGNIGIGTSSPQEKIDVSGNSASWSTIAGLQLTDTSGISYGRNWAIYNGGSVFGNLDFYVSTASGSSPSNALGVMSLTRNGNVGIGTTAPSYPLDVNGYVRTMSGIVFPNGTIQTTAASGGGGTITGVLPGTGLTGGGYSGNVTLAVDGTVARTNASNTFTAQQSFGSYPVLVNNTALYIDNENYNNYGARSWVLSGIAAELWNKAWSDTSWGSGSIIAGYAGTGKTQMFHVDTRGTTYTYNAFVAGGYDYAELVKVDTTTTKYEPGDVLVIDKSKASNFALSDQPYSRLIAGVYSTSPGVLASPHPMDAAVKNDEVPLALLGQAPCKVSTENGPINIGDLLVTSSTPGHAMRGDDTAKVGTILGKALEPLPYGTGKIKILVTLQ